MNAQEMIERIKQSAEFYAMLDAKIEHIQKMLDYGLNVVESDLTYFENDLEQAQYNNRVEHTLKEIAE